MVQGKSQAGTGIATPGPDPKWTPAAKDLYRVAEMVVKYFGEDDIDEFLDGDIALRDAARAALSKARGESQSGNLGVEKASPDLLEDPAILKPSGLI